MTCGNSPRTTFDIALKLAVEASCGSAPSIEPNAHYWQGGAWIPITPTGMPSLMNQEETIFPQGRAGNRAVNNRAPVRGRAWSDGSYDFDVTDDSLIALLYGVLGSVSAVGTKSTDYELAEGLALANGTSTVLDLVNYPSDGGAILRFCVHATSGAGWIEVKGVDPEGTGISEIISFNSAGSFYTRNSFSAVGTSSITVYSDNTGDVDVQGFKFWEYTITPNGSSNPTFSIERLGDPTAGATSKSFMHTAMVVQNVTLNNPAAQRDGLFTGSVTWEGAPTATCNATSLTSVSPVLVYPAWTQAINRDGVSWHRVTNFSLTIDGGNRNYRAAAGVQNPQGVFFGSQEVTGSMDILLNNEEEYARWKGASNQVIYTKWQTPYKLTSSDYQQLECSMNDLYLENPSFSEDEDAWSMSTDFRTINGAEGLITFKFKSNVPPNAYGLAVE